MESPWFDSPQRKSFFGQKWTKREIEPVWPDWSIFKVLGNKVPCKSSPNISQQYCEKWNFYINLMWILFGQLLSTIGLLFTPTSCQLVRTEQKIESEKERNFKCFNLHNFIYLTWTFSCFVWPCLVHNWKNQTLNSCSERTNY